MAEEEESLVLILEVQFRGTSETILVPYTEWDRLTVAELRRSLGETLGIPGEGNGSSDTWLVFKGRKLLGRELVKDIGIIFIRDGPCWTDNRRD